MKFKVLLILVLLFSFANVSALSVTVHIPEKYAELSGGERLYFEMALKYPENPTRVDLRLSYEVIDIDGNIIAQSKALKAVETQASFIDFIILPTELDNGPYSIDIIIRDYGDLEQRVGASFIVTSSATKKLMNYIYILIGAVIFLAILVVIALFKKK
jgi:hypothetical protein